MLLKMDFILLIKLTYLPINTIRFNRFPYWIRAISCLIIITKDNCSIKQTLKLTKWRNISLHAFTITKMSIKKKNKPQKKTIFDRFHIWLVYSKVFVCISLLIELNKFQIIILFQYVALRVIRSCLHALNVRTKKKANKKN